MNHPKLNRRSFIRSGALIGAAGLAIPDFISSHVLAAPGRPGANDRIGVAGIGVGRQGGSVVSFLNRMPVARFVAVADVNLPRAREMGKKLQAEPYQDYRRLLERKDVDAVVTATPEQWRILICLHCCQAGKDLYVEKPMSLTIKEGRMIVQAVRKYNRVFQTGSQQRSMEANRRGCELIRNQRLGKISRVIAYNYPSPWNYGLPAQPIPSELDWEMWCGPAPLVAFNSDLYQPRANPGWLSFRHFSGGEMTGWGSHGFDQVQWALGMDDSGPVEIWTDGPALKLPTYTAAEPQKRGDGICREPKLFYRYPGDIIMELANGPAGGAVFKGEKGTLTIDRAICKSDPEELAEEPIKDNEIHLQKSPDHLKNWIECIKSRQKPIADVEIGHRSATVCHLGNIARLLGRKLKWDPVKEIFPDDPEANTYLDRERRKPWVLPESI